MSRRSILVCSALVLASACADARLRKLSENISRDSVLKILADGSTTADSMPHIYREAQYFMNSKLYRVMYFTPTDRKEATDSLGQSEPLLDDELTPLVIVNDTLTGWGWDHWEDVAVTINVPVPARR